MYKNILCPIDGSSTSKRGMAEAISLAKSMDANLRFIHVVDGAISYWILDPAGAYDMAALIGSLREYGQGVLEDAKETAKASGVIADTKLVEVVGTGIANLILQEATEWPADLIVMGTHGRRGMRHLVMGSDAEDVVHQSAVPVMLLRNTEATSAA